MNITELEDKKVPKGHVTLVGVGRLGIRTGLHLAQIHRGGPKKITAIDAQKISKGDLIFRMLGGKIGDYKVDLLHDLRGIKDVIPIKEDITQGNLDLIEGDVICVEIAGGNIIPITAAIIKRAHEIGASTIGTAGIFSKGDQKIDVLDISEANSNNPWLKNSEKKG